MDKLIIGLIIISIGLGILLISTNQTEQIPSDQTDEQITSSSQSSPVEPKANEEYCNPSYPEVCIPAGPPDLDCEDIEYSNFTVLYPDEHRFDDDNDGIGCE